MASNYTTTSIFREVGETVMQKVYDITDIVFNDSTGRYKISGSFSGLKNGGVIRLAGCGDLDGRHSIIVADDTYVIINANYSSNIGTTGRVLKSGVFFFSEQYPEADAVVSGKNDRTPFIYMPIPDRHNMFPRNEPNLYIKNGVFEFVVCTYGRDIPDGDKSLIKSENLEPYVSECISIAYEFINKWSASTYCADGDYDLEGLEQTRVNINIQSNVDGSVKKLFNAEYSGIALRMTTSINKINCNYDV